MLFQTDIHPWGWLFTLPLMIEAVSGGWPLILASLKSRLETGESLQATRRWPERI
jgi:hypothetical protein